MSQPTNGNGLATAIREKASEIRALIDASDFMTESEQQTVRDATALLRVLGNVAEGMPLTKAIGAPGDWGYETALGRGVLALHRTPGVKAVPIRPATDEEVLEWAKRHDLSCWDHITEARAAFEDAETHHMTRTAGVEGRKP